MDYKILVQGIKSGLQKMRRPSIDNEEFKRRLEPYKHFDYMKLSDDEIFWMLTYVLFFNLGRGASMIEKKLPLFKQYLYGYRQLSELTDIQVQRVISDIGFKKQVKWCVKNANVFRDIIQEYGSFKEYLFKKFDIDSIYCSKDKLALLYRDLCKKFIGIGETAGWHFITEMGFFSLKPDKVIRRIFYRLGLIHDEEDLEGAINIGRNISEKLDITIRYLDIIFVKYGQVGQSDLLGTLDGICTRNSPKCDVCMVAMYCRYEGKGRKEEKVRRKKLTSKDNEKVKDMHAFDAVTNDIEILQSVQEKIFQIDLSNTPKLQKKYENCQ